ncbi:hypothetical protein LMG26411_05915 [Cupriavidus numazuensis]|uniref:Uncharacterized protein n=1 Tax=Cupriavidus numazuensis TaxID=221992 RepID=A0ABN7Q5W6_9BURK|nr:hypothetical protein LMG26411_05915 [Cupriavidus numazuensis]
MVSPCTSLETKRLPTRARIRSIPPGTCLMVTINVRPNRPEIKALTRPSHKVRETRNYYTSRIARHIEQPGSRHSKPAFVKILSRSSRSACAFTRPEPGTTIARRMLDATRLPSDFTTYAAATPIGWIYERRRLRYCYHCLLLTRGDVCLPFWRLDWLNPAFSMCEQHPGKLETTWFWNLYYLGNFSQLLRRAHATPHRQLASH